MYSGYRRCHWDVDRLFLSFQLSENVFLATVEQYGLCIFQRCRCDVSYCNMSLFISVFKSPKPEIKKNKNKKKLQVSLTI